MSRKEELEIKELKRQQHLFEKRLAKVELNYAKYKRKLNKLGNTPVSKAP